MKLTPHEQKILELVKSNPGIVTDSKLRENTAKKHGFTEKTLRNRIADFKKYGILKDDNSTIQFHNETSIDSNEIDIFKIISVLWRNRITITKNVLLVTVTSVIISLVLPLTFKSTAVLMPPSSESNVGIMGAISDLPLGGLINQSNDETLKLIAILKSRTVMENVIQKFNLIDLYQVENIEEALELLKESTIFTVDEEGTMRISVEFSTGWLHPENEEIEAKRLVAKIANYFVDQLDLINKNLNLEKASFHRKFVGERYQQNISELRDAEDSLKTFQEKYNMIALSEQTTVAIEAAANIKSRIIANEVKLGVMGSTLDSRHPDIEKVKKENYELQKKMDELEYGTKMDHVNQNNLFPVFSEVPQLGVKLLRLEREVRIQNTLFTFLTQQYEEAKIQEAKDTPTIQVLDWAVEPMEKEAPNRMIIVLGFFLFSLVLSFILVFYSESFSRSISTN